ncbi:type II toxin-antitoxin system prevent-host-death family antitoxin [Candidatus Gottesmanbacteria bacterium]|nr:type II toxin-antitoxin system prevent-host-death family antitoxin [Candidatus Gottesmanbacteria bacterium]
MPQTISIDDISQHLVSITDFRRNAGSYLDRIHSVGSYVLVRDGTPIVKVTPIKKADTLSTKDKLSALKRLVGGFKLGIGLTPEELNESYDRMYDEMLPR